MKIESVKLRRYRHATKLSQQEVANHLGISQSTYCDWEKKDSDIKLEAVIKLAEILKVELEEFAPETTSIKILNNNNNNSHDSSIIGCFNVTVDAQKLYKDLIESFKNQILLLETITKEQTEKIIKLEQEVNRLKEPL